MKTRHLVASFALVALASCIYKDDPYYCPGANPNNNCAEIDAGTDGPKACTSSSDCAAPTSVCDLEGSSTCVQCTPSEDDACQGSTPVCGSERSCRGCIAHDECASNACLPDGSCADDASIAYVDPTGTDNASCTRSTRCTKITKALATNRPFVKLTGATDEGGTVTIDSRNVTLLADPGAKLVRTANGIVLEVRGTSQVAIYDLEISGGSGPQGIGISMPAGNTAMLGLTRMKVIGNAGGGISASGGSLTISQSTISGNAGGGISVTGAGTTFNITNNFIYRNGNNSSAEAGGVNIGLSSPGASRLEFNTIVDNQATSGPLNAGGVRCSATSFAAPNNIIARNLIGASTTDVNAQTLGACTYPTSKVQNSITGLAFVSADAAPYNYKLGATSSAIDFATTTSPIDVDHEGDDRPWGAAKDSGADEYVP